MLALALKSALVLVVLLVPARVYCQIPFYTDDADTTAKRKFHLEFYNEYDWLHRSALPGKRQNYSNVTLNYGLTDRIELGINVPFVKIFNTRAARLGSPSGIGDIQFGIKARLSEERESSRLPAMSVVFYFQTPTGSFRKQTGSGVTECWLYGVLQKSLTDRTVVRLNGGVVFAGNRYDGLVNIRRVSGQVVTANASLVRNFTPKLKLGVEVFGGVSHNFILSRNQLQTQVGGSYALRDNFEFTFGVLAGHFPASSRAGVQVGFAYDIK